MAGRLLCSKKMKFLLEGEFGSNRNEDWSEEEFNAIMSPRRDNEGGLLKGEKFITLENGFEFTDNSWTRSSRFRLIMATDKDGDWRACTKEREIYSFLVGMLKTLVNYGIALGSHDSTDDSQAKNRGLNETLVKNLRRMLLSINSIIDDAMEKQLANSTVQAFLVNVLYSVVGAARTNTRDWQCPARNEKLTFSEYLTRTGREDKPEPNTHSHKNEKPTFSQLYVVLLGFIAKERRGKTLTSQREQPVPSLFSWSDLTRKILTTKAYLLFRGEDIRYNFTSHLHHALCRNHIETFIDCRLEKGEELCPSPVKAIEDSTLFLVIFSENYASSTWCLKELSKILDCSKNQAHHFAMPVFYRVDPAHVRKQSSESYKRAFEEHEQKSINKEQQQKRREDLTHAANLSGWHCSFNRNEAELITEKVQCVKHKLNLTYQSEENIKGLIGIHRRMEDVESLLYKDSNGEALQNSLSDTLHMNFFIFAYAAAQISDIWHMNLFIFAYAAPQILTLLLSKLLAATLEPPSPFYYFPPLYIKASNLSVIISGTSVLLPILLWFQFPGPLVPSLLEVLVILLVLYISWNRMPTTPNLEPAAAFESNEQTMVEGIVRDVVETVQPSDGVTSPSNLSHMEGKETSAASNGSNNTWNVASEGNWDVPLKGSDHKMNSRANIMMQKVSSWITVLTFPGCLLLTNYKHYSSLCNDQMSFLPIWIALLGMLNFTVFFPSLLLMAASGAHFTRLQKTVLLISAMLITMKAYVPFLGFIYSHV